MIELCLKHYHIKDDRLMNDDSMFIILDTLNKFEKSIHIDKTLILKF